MVNEVIDGTYRQTNLTSESDEYLAKREELRLAETAPAVSWVLRGVVIWIPDQRVRNLPRVINPLTLYGSNP